MEFPGDLRYTSRDEWLRLEGEDAVIGITDFAQREIGPIEGLDLPEVGKELDRGDHLAVARSTGDDWEITMPVRGRILARNDALTSTPALANSAPYGDGWLIRIRVRDQRELDALMDARAYQDGLPPDAR